MWPGWALIDGEYTKTDGNFQWTREGVTVKFASTTSLTLSRSAMFSWQTTTAKITVKSDAGPAAGSVTILANGKPLKATVTLDGNGKATYTLPKLKAGIYVITAKYAGGDTVTGSTSSSRILWVIF